MRVRRAIVGALILLCVPSVSFAANGVLSFSPARATFTLDDVFEITVVANTDGEAANAAEADISFNPQALSVVAISTDDSVLTLWPTSATYSNTNGTIRFSGTAPTPFSGSSATLIRVQFRAVSVMPGDIQIVSGAILKNDARATNIITAMQSGLYTIQPRQTQPAPVAPEESPQGETPVAPEVKGAAIQVPTISGYDDRVAAGGRIVLRGSASPNTNITVFLQYEDDAPQESLVRTTSDGLFTYAGSDPAVAGEYRAWAEAKSDTQVFTSEKVRIAAVSPGMLASVASLTSILAVVLPYLFLLILAGGALAFVLRKRT